MLLEEVGRGCPCFALARPREAKLPLSAAGPCPASSEDEMMDSSDKSRGGLLKVEVWGNAQEAREVSGKKRGAVMRRL